MRIGSDNLFDVRRCRVAVDDGYWCVISMKAHTNILEASLLLATDEATHELILLDRDAACFDECRILTVAVDTDRRCRSVG